MQAVKNAQKSVETARSGAEIVELTVSGMQKIIQIVYDASVKIKQLGKNSEQIGEIIQVIDDIADQTNLLALNAAIEAARAGEQGRGFAVVADEVRKLAERTTKATKEISQMIKNIQVETGNAVKAIELGSEEAAKGKEFAEKSGHALSEILSTADTTVAEITYASAANEELSAAAEQISNNIASINDGFKGSTRTIKEVSDTAEQLQLYSDNLKNALSNIKIDSAKIKNLIHKSLN